MGDVKIGCPEEDEEEDGDDEGQKTLEKHKGSLS
jgi:hypothetical protein